MYGSLSLSLSVYVYVCVCAEYDSAIMGDTIRQRNAVAYTIISNTEICQLKPQLNVNRWGVAKRRPQVL